MNADEIVEKLCYLAANSRSKHDVLIAAVNLIRSQRAGIADLKQQLSALQRREQAADGEWVEIPLDVTDDRWGTNKYNLRIKCTNCGFVTSRDLAGYAFCPVCGADMRGLQEAGKGWLK